MAQVRVRKRGKTYSYIFEAGKIDGKRKVVEKGGYATKGEAYNAGVEAYNDFRHGNIGITSEAITLKDFMRTWLENVVKQNVKPTTLQNYRSNAEKHIIPILGEMKVQELTPAILDKWIQKLSKKGFSFGFISGLHALIRQALDHAVYPAQLINSNPAVYIKVPRNAPRNIVKRHIISQERFRELLEKNPFSTPYYIPFLLLYHTGMRLGEVLGLTWDDIDFKAKKINVRRQIIYLHKLGNFLTELKTKNSRRYIIIDDFLIRELQRWQNQQAENEKQLCGKYICIYKDSEGQIKRQSKKIPCEGERVYFVCIKATGRLVWRQEVISTLISEGLNAHSFRHTHATQLIEGGAKAKAVAGRLGHTNTQITQNLYTHNTLKLQEEAAAIFAKNLQTNI